MTVHDLCIGRIYVYGVVSKLVWIHEDKSSLAFLRGECRGNRSWGVDCACWPIQRVGRFFQISIGSGGTKLMVGKKKSDPSVGPKKRKQAPVAGKRYFLATMDDRLIKDLKVAAIDEDKSASECLEMATRDWLARRAPKVGK